MQDKMLLISFNVLNSCLPCKDSPLSTTEDPFSQTNKFNEYYTSVALSAALKAKTPEIKAVSVAKGLGVLMNM